MKIIKKENSIILEPQNCNQVFLLGQFFNKFPYLGLKKCSDDNMSFSGIEIPDTSLDRFIIDSIKKFNTED